MGQSCGCQLKQPELDQLVISSNIQPYQNSKIQNEKENDSDDQISSQVIDQPMQFVLGISKDLYIYQQFLCDSLNLQNTSLRTMIFNICWDIQYYLSTATNIFEYNSNDWQDFIKSDERNQIIKCFNLKNQQNNYDYSDEQQPVTKTRFIKSDFEKWLKKKKIEIPIQSIHSKCLDHY